MADKQEISQWVKDAVRDLPSLPEGYHYELDGDIDHVMVVARPNAESFDMEL